MSSPGSTIGPADFAGMRNLLETLLKGLVDTDDAIVIHEMCMAYNVVYEVYVHEQQAGFIIGPGGGHANAIRTILNAASKRYKLKHTLHVQPVTAGELATQRVKVAKMHG